MAWPHGRPFPPCSYAPASIPRAYYLYSRARAAGRAGRPGQADILVANAGIQVAALPLEMADAQWHDVIDTSLTSTANAVRAFAPLGAAHRQVSKSMLQL